MITKKKQKFVGTKVLVDEETGEEYPMQMHVVEQRDFNFHKVWLENLVASLDAISNQKLKLALWIIEHLNSENQLIMTQRKMAAETGMSVQTVNKTIQALLHSKPRFLKRINGGAYMVNPEVLFKGTHSNRMGICFKYTDLEFDSDEEETLTNKEKEVINA